MRVAIVTESPLPQLNGVTSSVVRAVHHLRTHGHQTMVLAPVDAGGRTGAERVSPAPVVAMHSLPVPGYRQFRVAVPTSRALTSALRRFAPDVVHLASPFVTGGPAMRAARRLDLPVVAVFQTDVAGFVTRYRLSAAAEGAWQVVRFVHEQATLTLAPSATSVADLRRHGVPRVALWQRGVDADAFHPGHRDDAWRASVSPAPVLVGFVGRLAPEKQVADLAALDGLPGVQVVVIGDGPDRARLRAALPGAVFCGELRGPELSRAVAGLDVMAHPGPHETFCQAAQEAMAAGVPVVAVGAGAVTELVDPSRTGWLYPPGDLAALRGAVADLAGDTAKRRAMGAAARARVVGRTWQSVGDQLVGHYRDAIAAHQGVRPHV